MAHLLGVALLLAVLLTTAPPPQDNQPKGVLLNGYITYYAAGVMERVYQNRVRWGQVQPCNECIGMIAVLDKEHLGRHAYITFPGQLPQGPYLITDVARDCDRERLRQRGFIGEVTRERSLLLGMQGPLADVTIFIMDDHTTE